MKTMKIDNKIAIFLDHRAAINEAYRESASGGKEIYELKEELFDFHPRFKDNANATSATTTLKKKKTGRKRKLSDVKEDEIEAELKDLETCCRNFLQHLKPTDTQTHSGIPNVPLPRYWEENCNFPKFNGANQTSVFQTFNHQSKVYLIPPQCRFYNYDIAELPSEQLTTYDLIVIDPPWRNKYIRRLKRAHQDLGYQMLANTQLLDMPIARFIHSRTLVCIWCTNSSQHQQALLTEFLPAWNLRLVQTLKWLKLNTAGDMIGEMRGAGHKQPFETLYIACPKDSPAEFGASLQQVTMLLSVPSIVHSHKPPLLPWLAEYLPSQPKCLEMFARYLQPHFTSVGLEVLKLMDKRLYVCLEGG